ncbi:hypothetical protein [Streptomyces sp. NBC_00443]|uniref:hypothetical protein n=1 Tax=Streptomyces sp. NBC_00443 TaxID=2975743 RepID=UPI002E24EBAD
MAGVGHEDRYGLTGEGTHRGQEPRVAQAVTGTGPLRAGVRPAVLRARGEVSFNGCHRR